MGVPYTFGTATTSIPLSNLDANFNTPVTLGNTTVGLGNTVTTVGNLTLTNATISSGNVTVTSASLSGNLTFTGTGNRITGDFSNATPVNRVMFQTSTTNTTSVVGVIPNGTAVISRLAVFNNSDPTNAAQGDISVNSAEVQVRSLATGTGTALPLTMYTNGSERLRIDTSGNVGIGTNNPSNKLNVVGGRTDLAANSEIYALGVRYNSGTGIYYIGATNSATPDLVFSQTGGSERVRITNDGNVGIGTSSPAMTLHVVKNWTSGKATVGAQTVTSFASGGIAGFGCFDSDGSRALHLYSDSNGALAINSKNTPFIFGTNDTERMRITSGGDVIVGKTVTTDSTVGSVLFANGKITGTMAASTSGTSTFEIYSTGASAYRFYVTMDGKINCTSTTIAAISDVRLKENIEDIDVGLDAVMALKPRKFDWKDGKGKNIKGDKGWIAQEFEKIFPEMISTWKDPSPEGEEPYKAVAADLIPVLVKAIQELNAKVVELEAKLNAK